LGARQRSLPGTEADGAEVPQWSQLPLQAQVITRCKQFESFALGRSDWFA